MRAPIWKVAVLMGLVMAACFVPALEELDGEKTWTCNEEHSCEDGYSCVEGRCQPNEGTACRTGATAACGPDTGECQRGTRTCGEDGTYGPCIGAVQPMAESCNDRDDDCDGLLDEGLTCGDAGDPCAACMAAGRACASGLCRNCLEGHFEQGELCLPKLSLGAACSNDGMCASSHCVGGTCCGTSSCVEPPGQCYQPAGTCSDGTCDYTFKAAGSSCNDGNACTTNDRCDGSGVCIVTAVSCNTPPTQCHQPTGTCSGGTCSYSLKPAGSSCNDGNACTTGDVCNSAGTCAGSAVACNTPPTQCHQSAGTCSGGTCSYPLKPAGSACNDGSACTTGEVCNSSGTCAAAQACNTPPNSSCYQPIGTCTGGACTYYPLPLGTSCGRPGTCLACNGYGGCAHQTGCN
jgi:hypothetical protein